MSPQSRAASTINTTIFASCDNGWSSNACSLTTITAEINWASLATEYALHEIEFDSSTGGETHLSSPVLTSEQQRKRSSSCVSPPKNQQPFLSSYGSAFLSGIFADIAQATDEDEDDDDVSHQDDESSPISMVSEPFHKKARTTATSFHGRHQVEETSSGISAAAEGTVSEVSTPPFVSPRIKPKSSALKIQIFNDSVRKLQDMAFPSLSSQIPNTISSSSCAMQLMMDEVVNRQDEQEGPSYGWFVSTDDDLAEDSSTEPYLGYVPATKSVADLAFKAISPTPLNGSNQDVEVQQALAADTIDDVLGDLF